MNCTRTILLASLLATFVPLFCAEAAPPASIRHQKISAPLTPGTWRGPPGVLIEPPRRMRAEGFNWDHEIQIALPASYHRTRKAYPVLWVTDGSYWFETAVSIANVYNAGHFPELIVVAVGTPPDASNEYIMRRSYEFTPNDEGFEGFGSELSKQRAREIEKMQKSFGFALPTRYGGAPEFLKFLVDSLRPALAREYRMRDEHTLFGDSSGGLFCTYALFARPEAFSKYICGSPDLYWGNSELFRMEELYAHTHKDLPAEVFFGAGELEVLAGGGNDIVSSMARMAEILNLRAYPSLKLHVRIFPGEDHGSVSPLNLGWGLRTLWEGEDRKTN